MGIGLLGDPNIIFKRKFRWTFEVQNICNSGGQSIGSGNYIPPSFVKSASRPKLSTEEVEINFLNGTNWIPGKSKWQEMTIVYLDVSLTSQVQGATGNPGLLFTWLRSVYEFADPINLPQGARAAAYSGQGVLSLYDGCGSLLETWILNNMWPKEIDFGDLAYDSNDPCEINLTVRYSSVVYQPACGGNIPPPCCFPCS